jgi:hypothetical protein
MKDTAGTREAMNKHIREAQSTWGIRSPSTVAKRRIGGPIGQGIIEGIRDAGIPGAFAATLRNAKKKADKVGGFLEAGKDAAWGFLKGWWNADIPRKMRDTADGGVKEIKKFGRSPWPRTIALGLDAGRGFAIGLARSEGEVERNARGIAQKAAEAIQEQNKVRLKGVREAQDIERRGAQQIAKVQDKAAKQQLEIRKKAAKDALRVEKSYTKAVEENQRHAADFQEMTARNAEKQTNQINRAFERINQRAVEGGATSAQLQAIEEDRTRRLEEVSKAANDSIERSQKDSAKAQRSLERQRDKELREIQKQSAKRQEQIQKQTQKQIFRLEKERDRKLVANSRDTKEKLARIAKDSAKQQKNLAERQLREQRRFHDKQLREEKQHRVRRDRTRNIGLGRPRQNITQFETPRRIPQRTEELRRLADSNRDQERRRRSIVQQARSPESPGGKAITASEMDKIMDKHTKRSEARMRQAARLTQFNPQWWAAVDEGASKSFDHFTDMKPDAR